MPIDPAIIDSASQSINNAGNAIATASINKKTRKFAKEQYERQRQDALADWTRQNEYNSPQSQMARLREAGLNPNLVYGKGADNTSQAIRSTDSKSWNPSAPEMRMNASQSLMLSADLAMKQAQTDNLKVQNTVLDQETLLKKAQTLATLKNADISEFDLGMKVSLRDTNLDFRKGELRKLNADIDYTLDQNERAAAQNAQSLQKGVQEILNLRLSRAKTDQEILHIKQMIKVLEKDERLKQLDIELKEKGIQPNDNIFFRIIGRILADPTILDKLDQKLDKVTRDKLLQGWGNPD